MGIFNLFSGNKKSETGKESSDAEVPKAPTKSEAEGSSFGKKKTLPKDIEVCVNDDEALKTAFEKCDINAYGGFNAGNIFFYKISEEMIKWCLGRGADINFVDRYGFTPLAFHSNTDKSQEQALLLIKYGADIEAGDGLMKEGPVFFAVRSGSLKVVDALVEKGVNLNAVNYRGYTPLEAAFSQAMPIDMEKIAKVTQHLFNKGVTATERLRNDFLRVAGDIEFRRKDIAPDLMPRIDAALDKLYELLEVDRVPHRQEYDGKSPIVVKAISWQKQHAELWNLLVPGSGHATTVQGEVIRITGKVCYEILDNGGGNWDEDYHRMVVSLKKYLQRGARLTDDEYDEIEKLTKDIKNRSEEDLNRLTELSVKWVVKNPEPMAIGEVGYER